MGTNYYMQTPACSHCGRGPERERHIGKSSAGWCFSLRVYPDDGINTLEDWKPVLASSTLQIVDEYGDTLTADEMLARITDRSWGIDWNDPGEPPAGCHSWDYFLTCNHAEKGPNGLLRHRLGHGCVAHGEGTWDYVDRPFS